MPDLVASRYQLLELLGRGAMGTVWKAHDTVLDRLVAVKELGAIPGVSPEEARERFLVEARAAARLRHPSIVSIHDVVADSDRAIIAMELVQGPTLSEIVSRSGAQPALVRPIMAQVASALAAAHAAGVVHRDLKPDNVFWTEGRAVVADFGLARIGAGVGTMIGTVMGTPGYMAPEQVRGHAVGPAVDVFGWGATAYELATGRAPFGSQSDTDPSALAYRVVHEAADPLVLPGDPTIAAIINKALAKDPAHRPADGSALVELLGQRDRRAPAALTPGRRPSAARPLAWVLAGAGVLVAIVLVGVLLGRPDAESTAASPSTTALPSTTSTTLPPTTTTTALPTDFPTTDGALPAGFYQTKTLPAMTLRLAEGWQVFTPANRDDLVEFSPAGSDNRGYLSFVRVDAMYKHDFVLPADNLRDPPGSTTNTPADLIQYLAEDPRLTVSDRRTETIDRRQVSSAEVTVTSGDRRDTCSPQSLDGTCVGIFPTAGTRYLLAGGYRNRIFVLRTSGPTVLAVVEAPAEQFDAFLASARTVIASVSIRG